MAHGEVLPPHQQNWMHPIRWVPPDCGALLDVGCNVGELLAYAKALYPDLRVAGVEVNPAAVAEAHARFPDIEVLQAGAERLPFPDASFGCVTCIEVLEHVPEHLRKTAFGEMHRVLRPGGRLVVRVPHAGMFQGLDPNNLRFRFPRLYRRFVGAGQRDAGYSAKSDDVVWHKHFTAAELQELAGEHWELEGMRRGALLLFPLAEIVSWPLYRKRKFDSPVFRALLRLKEFDIGVDYGRASDDILLALRKPR